MTFKSLFMPLKVGSLEAPNRFFMAPLTRCRADPETWVPNNLMAEYYSQRAQSAGLVITEATCMMEKAITFHTEAAIYNDAQVKGWKQVTDKVHAVGGRIFCQIFHGGRAAHPLNNAGEIPVAPSPIAISHHTGAEFNPTGEKVSNPVPRELTDEEIPGFVDAFVDAARRAMDAGFDGVEVHGANGYLIDQFLAPSSNKRETGPYSGETMETRSKFLFDILDAVVAAVGADKVGLRISPLGTYQDIFHENPVELTEYIAKKCSELDIAYLHVIRGDMMKMYAGEKFITEDVIAPAREHFKNALVVNLGYDVDEAEKAIEQGDFDAVAFGTKFLANPDLPERVLAGVDLNPPDMKTFYTKEAKGYTDYPFMDELKN